MRCPKCNQDAVKTVDSVNVSWNETYRRKKCKNCNHVFYTAEFEVVANKRFKKEWELYRHRNSY